MTHSQGGPFRPQRRDKLPKEKNAGEDETGKKARLKSSTRPAPVIAEAAPPTPKAQAKTRGSQQSDATATRYEVQPGKPGADNRNA